MKTTIASIRAATGHWIDELREFEWNDLRDIETVGVWPAPVKFLLGLLVFLACAGAGYWFHIKDLQAELESVTAQESGLRQDLESKALLSANLEVYQEQMRVMQETFGTLLAQLPGETEVPGLLEDISFTGENSGLEFSTIQLQSEQEQEYYIELPITITVSGSYHDFGAFVSGVASLPRIVTLHDFSITRGSNSEGENALDMNITARTYRYKSQ